MTLTILHGFWPCDTQEFMRTYINKSQCGKRLFIQYWFGSNLFEKLPFNLTPKEALERFTATRALFPEARLVFNKS